MATLASSLIFILLSFLRIRKLERDVYRYQKQLRNWRKYAIKTWTE
jgi:hypothetical protein